MNHEAPALCEITETDLATVQGGMTQEELVDFIERFRRYQEENQRRMIDDVLW